MQRSVLYLCSGVLLIASLPMAIRCVVLFQPKPKATVGEVEQKLAELTNVARQEHALAKYNIHPGLALVARAHAEKMAADADYETPPTLPWMEEHLRYCGYGFPIVALGVRAGVIYRSRDGGLSVRQALNKWVQEELAKPQAQDRSILNPAYPDVGIGVFLEETSGVYYVAFVFAKRQLVMVPKEP